jgi:D-alanyl-D-alanine carboxypeptidase/D-alanyl-D-alanine-endopeptidase (penicillin-binding protein 4)
MRLIILALLIIYFPNPSSGQQSEAYLEKFLSSPPLKGAHAGVIIVDSESKDTILRYQSEKYFLPASTTKLFTLYSGLRLMGDSLPGIQYRENKDSLWLYPTGDPTLMNKRISSEKVMDYLRRTNKTILICNENIFNTTALAPGWSVDDLDQAFMPERSLLPVSGNIFKFISNNSSVSKNTPDYPFPIRLKNKNSLQTKRAIHQNEFFLSNETGKGENPYDSAPFISSLELSAKILEQALNKPVTITSTCTIPKDHPIKTIYSEKSDSIFKIMMHESDNFLAEQLLLMTSLIHFGYMDEKKIIDYLIKNELKNLPQPPKWVDGSGLSRYNLFSPEDMVFILQKSIDEFGLNRILKILPFGGKGTLSGYYESAKPYLYGKTGSLSNNSCLSGILMTNKNRQLVFSIMVNNFPGKSAPVRKEIESFLKAIKDNF